MLAKRYLALAAMFAGTAFLTLPALAVDGTPGGVSASDGSSDVDVSGGDATDGGKGGDGGGAAVSTGAPLSGVSVNADGGAGGDINSAGPAGDGGNGGNVAVTIASPINGNVTIDANGRNGGSNTGSGGDGKGGSGGNIEIAVDAPVNGDIQADAVVGKSQTTGTAGSIVISIDAPVSGDVHAEAYDGQTQSTGTIVVSLGNGAAVGGVIKGTEEVVDAKLSFAMSIANKAQFDAANVALATADATSGTVTINGKTFTWVGFRTIEDLLSFVGQMEANGGKPGFVPVSTRYLGCRPGTVIAYQTLKGIVFNAKDPASKNFFHVGDMQGDSFQSANPLGWTVALTATKPLAIYKVLDEAGNLITTCKR